MGRPIKESLFGALATTGEQIQVTAWVPGDSQARNGFIVRQKTSTGYIVDTTGAGGGTGFCKLVNTTAAAAGQMTLKVFPFGDSGTGTGATATALMGVLTHTLSNDGTGGSYGPTTTVTLAGNGTGTQATYTVATARVRAATQQAAGTGFANSGDTLTFTTGFSTPCILTVTASGGAITSLAVTQAGVRSIAATTNPVTPDIITSSSGAGATVNLSYEILTLAIATPGSYSVLPSGALATTHSGTGTGATVTVDTFQVVGGTVTAPGADYQSVVVTPSGGGGTGAALTGVITNGALSGFVVTTAGTGYTSIPTLAITAAGAAITKYAKTLSSKIVKTFDNVVLKWRLQGQVVSAGEAHIQSA